MKRPEKIPHVLKVIKECISSGQYFDTTHAKERKSERNVTLPQILYVLKNGYHEKKKDEFKPEYNDWCYAIKGVTIDGRDLRIVVAFVEKKMVIITVIDTKRGSK